MYEIPPPPAPVEIGPHAQVYNTEGFAERLATEEEVQAMGQRQKAAHDKNMEKYNAKVQAVRELYEADCAVVCEHEALLRMLESWGVIRAGKSDLIERINKIFYG